MIRAWLLAACALASACGDDAHARAHAADLASFDRVWTTVRDRHFDPTLGGLDWDAVRAELRPKVVAARNRHEARAVMRDMLARLKQTHFAIIESGNDEGGDGTFGLVGIDVRSVDGQVLVTEVEPDSPADLADVGLGWRLESIDGKPIAELLSEVRRELRASPLLAAEESGAVFNALSGSTHRPVVVTFTDGASKTVERSLDRQDATGRIVVVGNMAGLVAYDAKRIGDAQDIGYVRVGAFLDPATVMTRYRKDLASMQDARGVIIDLRGNSGGLGPMAGGMMGELVRREAVLGTSRSRESEQRTVVNPQPHPFDGPVAVLVDELSMSTSEIFAAGVQDLARGRVFGRPTPGAALPSTFEKLPNGDIFQFAVATYVTSKGRTLEGNGVVPDEVVALDRASLLAGKDTAIEAAETWIRHQQLEIEEPSP